MDKTNKKAIIESLEGLAVKIDYIDSFLNIITDYIDFTIDKDNDNYPLLILNELLRNKNNILSLCYDTSNKINDVNNNIESIIKTIRDIGGVK